MVSEKPSLAELIELDLIWISMGMEVGDVLGGQQCGGQQCLIQRRGNE